MKNYYSLELMTETQEFPYQWLLYHDPRLCQSRENGAWLILERWRHPFAPLYSERREKGERWQKRQCHMNVSRITNLK